MPTRFSDVRAVWRLADGREIDISLKLRAKTWGGSGAGAREEIRAAAKRSDFLSYNGHSGYGVNVTSFEADAIPSSGSHLLLFVNGCSSFGYFEKHPAEVPSSRTSGRDVDLIANLRNTYFETFAITNIALLRLIAARSASYAEILSSLQQTQGSYDALLTIRGEENNPVSSFRAAAKRK
jgi:hypothetical protein